MRQSQSGQFRVSHREAQVILSPGFPLGLENLEKWEGIFQSGKSQGIWDKYYLIFLVIFKWTVYYLLKWIKLSVKKNKTLKKYWKMAKNTGKVREFCQSWKAGTLISWCANGPIEFFQIEFYRIYRIYQICRIQFSVNFILNTTKNSFFYKLYRNCEFYGIQSG